VEDKFNYIEQIDQYLANEMSMSDRDAFENELSTNETLKEEVAIQSTLRDVVISSSLGDIRSLMENDFKEQSTADNKKTRNKKIGKWIGIAGLFLLAPAIGYFLINDEEKKENNTAQIEKHETSVIQNNLGKNNEAIAPKEKVELEKTLPVKSVDVQEKDSREIDEKTLSPVLKEEHIDIEENSQENKLDLTKHDDSPQQIVEDKIENDVIVAEKQEVLTELTFNGKLKTIKTSYEASNGKIIIEGDLTGGEKPYQYFIYDGELQIYKEFENLEAGKYVVQAIDGNGKNINIGECEIKEDLCISSYNQSFMITFDKYWEIPVTYNKQFNFKVYGRSSILYEHDFESGDETHWNGKTTSGGKIGLGYYRFEIDYENGEKCFGEITIGN